MNVYISGSRIDDMRGLDTEEVGMASCYGKKFAGRRTASSERYNIFAMTAAYRSLSMGA